MEASLQRHDPRAADISEHKISLMSRNGAFGKIGNIPVGNGFPVFHNIDDSSEAAAQDQSYICPGVCF